MGNIPIDARSLRILRDHARNAGTLSQWSDLALEWADKAEAHVAKLAAQLIVAQSLTPPTPASDAPPA